MFAIRREVLDALLADAEWRKRFDRLKTMAEVECVISDFCKAHGYKIVRIGG